MKAVAIHSGAVEASLVDIREPTAAGRGEVICKSLQVGVCGTDREIVQSAAPWTPEGEEFLVLGHECLARVEEVGDDVDDLRVGDLVVPLVRRAFDRAAARPDMLPFGNFTERGIVCEHGFSSPCWIDQSWALISIEPSLAPFAVLAEPISVAEKGVNEAILLQQARLGEDIWSDTPPRVLVTGLGPIAFAAVIACRGRNWPVTVLGRDDEAANRPQIASQFGADYITAPAEPPASFDVERDGFDFVIECTGADTVVLAAAQRLASCGVMVWLGSSRQPMVRPHNVDLFVRSCLMRNQLLIGSVNSARRDFDCALQRLTAFAATHPSQLDALVTSRVTLDDAPWHFGNRQPEGIKTVVMYE